MYYLILQITQVIENHCEFTHLLFC